MYSSLLRSATTDVSVDSNSASVDFVDTVAPDSVVVGNGFGASFDKYDSVDSVNFAKDFVVESIIFERLDSSVTESALSVFVSFDALSSRFEPNNLNTLTNRMTYSKSLAFWSDRYLR